MKKASILLLTLILCIGSLAGCADEPSASGDAAGGNAAVQEEYADDPENGAEADIDIDALAENIQQTFAQCLEYHNGTTQMINDGLELGLTFDENLLASIDALAAEFEELKEMDLNTYTEDEMLTLQANLDESLAYLVDSNNTLAQAFADAGYEPVSN